MSYKTQCTKTIIASHEYIGFGVKDSKGREIGALLTIRQETFEPLTADAFTYSNLEPGLWFSFRPHATRDGDAFGATTRRSYFKTLHQARMASNKYLTSAKKRALKKAGA